MTAPLERWVEHRDERDPEVQRAIALVRSDVALEPLGDVALERVRRRLFTQPRRVPSRLWRPAGAIAALALSSLAAAAIAVWRVTPLAMPTANVRNAVKVRAPSVPVPVDPATPEVTPPDASPPPTATREPVRKPKHQRPIVASALTPDIPSSGAAEPGPRTTPLAEEAVLLARALHQLEADKAPAAALATLTTYAERFPNGTLAKEAFVTRIDALVRLGQRAVALRELDAVEPGALASLPRGDELWVLRAELLAEAGDCASALTAFEQVDARQPRALRERAEWGRATCLAALGDASGSRRALERYVETFPEGRFAASARSALARGSPP